MEHSAEVGAYMHEQGKALLDHPTITDIRGQGMLMVPRTGQQQGDPGVLLHLK